MDHFNYRLRSVHVSSHLGDEIGNIEERNNKYSREFFENLILYRWVDFRFYGGITITPRSEPRVGLWTFQFGAEWKWPAIFKEILGIYAAMDFQIRQELEWVHVLYLQTGILIGNREKKRYLKFGFEFFTGQVNEGQFFDREMTDIHFIAGLVLDI